MARVFQRPIIAQEALCRLLVTAGLVSEEADKWVKAGISGVDLPSFAGAKQEAGGIASSEDIDRDMLYVSGIGKDPKRLHDSRIAFNLLVADHLPPDPQFVWGFDAQVDVIHSYLTDTSGAVAQDNALWRELDAASREIAALGMAASLISPRAAQSACSEVCGYRELCRAFPRAALCAEVSDSWRYGVSHFRVSDATRLAIDEHMVNPDDVDICVLSKGGWKRRHPDTKAILWLDILLIFREDKILVLDNTQRCEIAELLRSIGRWALYALNYRGAGTASAAAAVNACVETFNYLSKAIDARKSCGFRLDTLARHMKSAYAMRLSQVEVNKSNVYETLLAEKQLAELAVETQASRGPERSWYDVISTWSDDLALDMGTAWNMLPAPDAIPATQDKAMREKMTAVREYDEAAMSSFLAYSRTVITAHMLVKHQTCEGVWKAAPADIEEHAWVKSCRRGVLSYPSSREQWGPHLTCVLAWKKHVENWQYTAQDVAHVFAVREMYETSRGVHDISRDDSRELTYALKHGSTLSGRFTVEEVRKGMECGKLPGDRIGLVSSKRENTKTAVPVEDDGKGATRETVSEDDIGREVFTEADKNFNTIGAMLEGIASRCSRATMERTVDKILVKAENGAVLLSLDIKGWSPMMFRRLEMAFGDLLMEFFDIPATMRISMFFSSSTFVNSRAGYHSLWDTTEGSVQGFFVTLDTILHSMIAQFALASGRAEGIFHKDATISKIVQIDDIVAAVDLKGTLPDVAVDYICKVYKSLGPVPDIVKTLFGDRRCHFLNRAYKVRKGMRAEIITAAKIFARSDREHERKLTSLADRVNSVFGSAIGASDRGANPVATYTLAVADALRQVRICAGKEYKIKTTHSLIIAWLPPSLCGWGIPTYSQWVTRSAICPVDAGLGALSRLARTFRDINPQISKTISDVLRTITTLPLQDSTTTHLCDDPHNVSLKLASSANHVIRSILSEAALKATIDPSLRSMLEQSTSSAYEKSLNDLITTCEIDAAQLALFAESLPHSVIRSLTTRAESSEALLGFIPFKKRRKALQKIRLENTLAAKCGDKLLRLCISSENDAIIPTGAEIAAELREKRYSSFNAKILNSTSPSVEDLIAHTGDRETSTIHVHFPSASPLELYTGFKGSGITRTHEAPPLVMFDAIEHASWDPITNAYDKLLKLCAVVSASGAEASYLAELWGYMWVGHGDIPYIKCTMGEGSNASRLASRMSRSTYTVAAMPNAVSSIKVDASRLLQSVTNKHTTVDIMSIIYTLKACSVTDLLIGGTKGASRYYSLRYADYFISDTRNSLLVPVAYSGRPALVGAQARALETEMGSTTRTAGVVGIKGTLDIPTIITSASVGETAYDVLASIPIGTVLSYLAKSSIVGSLSEVSKRQMLTPGADRPDTPFVAPEVTASAVADRRGKALSLEARGCMKDVMLMLSSVEDGGGEINEAAIARCNWLVTHRGPILRAMGILKHIQDMTSGNTRAFTALFNMFSRGGQNSAETWGIWSRIYEQRAADKSRGAFFRSRDLVKSAVMACWVSCHERNISAPSVWALSLRQTALAITLTFRRTGVSSSLESLLENKISRELDSLEVSFVSFNSRLCRQILSQAYPDHCKDRLEMLDGTMHALSQLFEFWKQDWMAPIAAEMIPLNMATNSSGPSDDLVIPDFSSIDLEVKQLGVSGGGLDFECDDWRNMCRDLSLDPDSIEVRNLDWVISEFRQYTPGEAQGHKDT